MSKPIFVSVPCACRLTRPAATAPLARRWLACVAPASASNARIAFGAICTAPLPLLRRLSAMFVSLPCGWATTGWPAMAPVTRSSFTVLAGVMTLSAFAPAAPPMVTLPDWARNTSTPPALIASWLAAGLDSPVLVAPTMVPGVAMEPAGDMLATKPLVPLFSSAAPLLLAISAGAPR